MCLHSFYLLLFNRFFYFSLLYHFSFCIYGYYSLGTVDVTTQPAQSIVCFYFIIFIFILSHRSGVDMCLPVAVQNQSDGIVDFLLERNLNANILHWYTPECALHEMWMERENTTDVQKFPLFIFCLRSTRLLLLLLFMLALMFLLYHITHTQHEHTVWSFQH